MSWFRKLSRYDPNSDISRLVKPSDSVLSFDLSRSSASQSSGLLDSIWSSIKSAYKDIFNGKAIENLIKQETGSGATNKFKEETDYGVQAQNWLDEQAFERQQEYFDRNLSLPAQMRQAKEAGINPMTIFGNGADVSSSGGVGTGSSAPTGSGAGSSGVLQMLSSLFGMSVQQERIKNEYELALQRNDIARYDAETRRKQSDDYIKYLQSLTRKTDQDREQSAMLFPNTLEQVRSQTDYFKELCNTERGKQALMEANIDLMDAEKAIKLRQEAILAAQEQYADKYYSATASLQYYYSQIAKTTSEFERRTLLRRIDLVETQYYDMLYSAALKSKSFENFSQQNIRSWIDTGSNAIRALGTVALGAAGLSAAGRVVPGASLIPPGSGGVLGADGLLYKDIWQSGYKPF